MKSSKVSKVSQGSATNNNNNVSQEAVTSKLHGYLNFVTVGIESQKESLSIDALTILLTDTMLDTKWAKATTQEGINLRALIQACKDKRIPDGTKLAEGRFFNIADPDDDGIPFRFVWRRNHREGNESVKPTWDFSKMPAQE